MSISTSNSQSRTGRPPAAPLQLHQVFRNFLRTAEILSGISQRRLLEQCGACSFSGALNILRGAAKQTTQSLATVNTVAAVIGCPHDQVIVGLDLPSVPFDVIVPILDTLADEGQTPFARAWAIRRKREVTA